MFIIALFGYGLCDLFIGPSQIVGIQDNHAVNVIYAAIIVQGILNVYCKIPVVPEIIDRLKVKLNTVEGDDEHLIYDINDKANDWNAWFFACG